MPCSPGARDDVVAAASPRAFSDTVARTLPPSRNWTYPVGVTIDPATTLTTNVTSCPASEDGLEERMIAFVGVLPPPKLSAGGLLALAAFTVIVRSTGTLHAPSSIMNWFAYGPSACAAGIVQLTRPVDEPIETPGTGVSRLSPFVARR